MGLRRVLSTGAVLAATAAAAALVIGMATATPKPSADASPAPSTSAPTSSEPVFPTASSAGDSPSASATETPSPAAPTVVPSASSAAAPPAAVSAAAVAPAPRTTAAAPTAAHVAAPAPAVAAPVVGQALPLGYSTGNATRVITVVAAATWSTTATLQAWNKAPGGGWLRYGAAVTAHVGADGLSSSPSESRSATPIGSFSLTQAFGYYANPGTGLPYLQTTPNDWWISQPGPLYNTEQRCSSNCAFSLGDPNEHLYYETPYYNYAVVIDYNTPNAGPVRAGGGSAFFLHVTDGTATAGCVAIPQANLVPIMQWLTPAAAPRILIGVA